jgi:hypothetical protein
MEGSVGLFAEVLKIGLALGGILYAGEVLLSFLRSGERFEPAVDPERPFRSAGHLLIGAGVLLAAALVTLGQPIVEMLAEASAEVGEWALAKRKSQVTVRHRDPVGRAA